MARVHLVKAFRGQRKCQFTPDPTEDNRWPNKCGESQVLHPGGVTPTHQFTQKPLTCGFCGKAIEIGMGYKWVAPRAHRAARGIRKNRHTDCPGWKPSELTSSPHLSAIYSAQEGADEAIAQVSAPESHDEAVDVMGELTAIAEGMGDEIESVAEGYRESSEAMEEGLGHPVSGSEELADQAETMEQWAEELRGVTLEEPDEDDDDLESWLEDQVGTVQDVVSNMP